MHKKVLHYVFISILSALIIAAPSFAKDKLTPSHINNLIYKTISQKGSFNNLYVNITDNGSKNTINSIQAGADNIMVEGVHINSAKIKTLNGPIKIKKENGYIRSSGPFSVHVYTVLSEENINKSIKQNLYKYLKDLKIKIGNGNYMYISFLDPVVKIESNKIKATATLSVKGLPFYLPVSFETNINIINKKVVLKDLIVQGINIQALANALQKQNIPLYDLRKTEERLKINIDSSSISILDKEICVKGIFTVQANAPKFKLKY